MGDQTESRMRHVLHTKCYVEASVSNRAVTLTARGGMDVGKNAETPMMQAEEHNMKSTLISLFQAARPSGFSTLPLARPLARPVRLLPVETLSFASVAAVSVLAGDASKDCKLLGIHVATRDVGHADGVLTCGRTLGVTKAIAFANFGDHDRRYPSSSRVPRCRAAVRTKFLLTSALPSSFQNKTFHHMSRKEDEEPRRQALHFVSPTLVRA